MWRAYLNSNGHLSWIFGSVSRILYIAVGIGQS